MPRFLPYSKQALTTSESKAVQKVLKSDWITQGPEIQKFEQRLAKACQAKYAVAVCNGTAALHLALLACGIQPDQEVITTPLTFAATLNSILYCQSRPVLADIDADTLNISPEEIQKKITSRTWGILPVHFAGLPVALEAIQKIAQSRKLKIIEDGCHALGASYKIQGKWHKVGSCSHSDACVFSFHPVKSITTGEGGAITTNQKDIYEKLLILRSHGMAKEESAFQNEALAFSEIQGKRVKNPWYYEIASLGFNYRITDIQSAIGSEQLQRLKQFIDRRADITSQYDEAFAEINGLKPVKRSSNQKSAHHLYVIQLDLKHLTASRAEIFHELRNQGLGVQIHYIPLHYQPFYRFLDYRKGDFPNTEAYYEGAISIPLYPTMTARDVKHVIQIIHRTLEKHSGKQFQRKKAVLYS